jgi:hypothetical protein
LILTLQSIINLRLKYYRMTYNLIKPVYNIIFEKVTCDDMDRNIMFYLKYLANYCFFKFGLEVWIFFFIIEKLLKKLIFFKIRFALSAVL